MKLNKPDKIIWKSITKKLKWGREGTGIKPGNCQTVHTSTAAQNFPPTFLLLLRGEPGNELTPHYPLLGASVQATTN